MWVMVWILVIQPYQNVYHIDIPLPPRCAGMSFGNWRWAYGLLPLLLPPDGCGELEDVRFGESEMLLSVTIRRKSRESQLFYDTQARRRSEVWTLDWIYVPERCRSQHGVFIVVVW